MSDLIKFSPIAEALKNAPHYRIPNQEVLTLDDLQKRALIYDRLGQEIPLKKWITPIGEIFVPSTVWCELPAGLEQNERIMEKVDDIQQKMSFVLNPHTSFSCHDSSTRHNLIDAITASLSLANHINMQIHLPPSMQIKDIGLCYPFSIPDQNGIPAFKSNVWMPDASINVGSNDQPNFSFIFQRPNTAYDFSDDPKAYKHEINFSG